MLLKVQPRAIDRLHGNEWVIKGVVLNSFLIDEFDGIDINELQMGKPFLFRVFRFVKASVSLTVYIADDVIIKLLAGQHVAFFLFKMESFDQRGNTGTLLSELDVVGYTGLVCSFAEPRGVVEFPGMGDVLNGGERRIFPVMLYVFKVFCNLANWEFVVEAFALDEAGLGIFQGHEVYAFVFFSGTGSAVEDDMPILFQQIAYIAFIGQSLFCFWVWGIRRGSGFGVSPLISDSFQLFLLPALLFRFSSLFLFLFLPFLFHSPSLFFPPQGILGRGDSREDWMRGGLRRFRFEPVADEVNQGEGANDDTGGFYGNGFIGNAKLVPFLLFFDGVLPAFFPESFREVDFFPFCGSVETVPVNVVRANIVEIFLFSVFIRLSCGLMNWNFTGG